MSRANAQAPRVSVVTPMYNAEPYLQDLFASLAGQTYGDFELVLSDDGSKDASVASARRLAESASFPVQILVAERNGGPAAARNRGMSAANGSIIAFCDADDSWRPDKLERQIALFDTDPELTIVGCQGEIVPLDGDRLSLIDDWVFELEDQRIGLFWACFMQMSTVAVRAAHVPEGGFDENLLIGEDWDFLLRVSMEGKLAVIAEPMIEYRRFEETQMTRQAAARWRDTLEVVERNLARYSHMLTRAQIRKSRGKASFSVAEALADPPHSRLSGIPHYLRAVRYGYRRLISLNKIVNVVLRNVVPGWKGGRRLRRQRQGS